MNIPQSLIEAGIASPAAILAVGEDGLTAVKGVGTATARRLLQEAAAETAVSGTEERRLRVVVINCTDEPLLVGDAYLFGHASREQVPSAVAQVALERHGDKIRIA